MAENSPNANRSARQVRQVIAVYRFNGTVRA